jgi:hypothetical protein
MENFTTTPQEAAELSPDFTIDDFADINELFESTFEHNISDIIAEAELYFGNRSFSYIHKSGTYSGTAAQVLDACPHAQTIAGQEGFAAFASWIGPHETTAINHGEEKKDEQPATQSPLDIIGVSGPDASQTTSDAEELKPLQVLPVRSEPKHVLRQFVPTELTPSPTAEATEVIEANPAKASIDRAPAKPTQNTLDPSEFNVSQDIPFQKVAEKLLVAISVPETQNDRSSSYSPDINSLPLNPKTTESTPKPEQPKDTPLSIEAPYVTPAFKVEKHPHNAPEENSSSDLLDHTRDQPSFQAASIDTYFTDALLLARPSFDSTEEYSLPSLPEVTYTEHPIETIGLHRRSSINYQEIALLMPETLDIAPLEVFDREDSNTLPNLQSISDRLAVSPELPVEVTFATLETVLTLKKQGPDLETSELLTEEFLYENSYTELLFQLTRLRIEIAYARPTTETSFEQLPVSLQMQLLSFLTQLGYSNPHETMARLLQRQDLAYFINYIIHLISIIEGETPQAVRPIKITTKSIPQPAGSEMRHAGSKLGRFVMAGLTITKESISCPYPQMQVAA